jgi:two-component system, NtrC family, nitrogen regulation sensor histidine kinase NtrY
MAGSMAAPAPTPATPARPPRRFRRRLLLVLLLAGVGPLAVWGLVGRSIVDRALSVAPPVGPLLGQAAEVIEGAGQGRGASAGSGSAGSAAPLASPTMTTAALLENLRAAELHLAQAELARRRLLDMAPRYFLAALVLSAVLVAGSAWLLGRRLSRPVESLAEGMARFARGDLDHEVRVPAARGDELDFLARELNGMGRELASQRVRLASTEKLAAWRDVARAMAHDLKNPLTAMRMAMGRLARPGRTEAAAAEAVSLLQQELDVLIRMTQSFSDFARLPDPVRRPLELGALLQDLAALYREERADIPIEVRVAAPATVLADADQLRRAFGNLIKNAVEASRPGDGPVEVSLEPVGAAAPPSVVRVAVRDAGAGIPAPIEGGELIRGLASKKAAGRSGLGLPIAHKIFHDHGGGLRLAPRAPRGTEALVELPRAGAATAAGAAEALS